MVYYTDRPVKGSGTGGQVNPQSPKPREALDWIISQRPGTRIRRNDMPFSHHVADHALHEAEEMRLVTEGRVRTDVAWQPWLIQ